MRPLRRPKGSVDRSDFSCALAIFSPSLEHRESLLDLLPRLRGRRSLAEAACRKILEGIYFVLNKLGNWQLSRRFLEQSLDLARKEDLKIVEGRLLCCLGELLDRMEYPEGLEMIAEGIEILTADPQFSKSTDFQWSQAYLSKICLRIIWNRTCEHSPSRLGKIHRAVGLLIV